MVRNEDDLELARRFDMVRCLWGVGQLYGVPGSPQMTAPDPVLKVSPVLAGSPVVPCGQVQFLKELWWCACSGGLTS